MTLGEILYQTATNYPEQAAVICEGEITSYAELDHATNALACLLWDQGLRAGDRAGIHWANRIDAVRLLFACYKAGLIAVPVNTRLKAPEIDYVLSHADAAVCYSEPPLAGLVEEVQRNGGWKGRLLTGIGDSAEERLFRVDPVHPCTILYTSGSTARPKGVTHNFHPADA